MYPKNADPDTSMPYVMWRELRTRT